MSIGQKFGSKIDFGAQLGHWRALVGVGDQMGAHTRPHVVQIALTMWERTGSSPFMQIKISCLKSQSSYQAHARHVRAVGCITDAVRMVLSGTVRIGLMLCERVAHPDGCYKVRHVCLDNC